MNYQNSRRDDLESLIYTLIYLIKGNLPWKSTINRESFDEILNKKINTKISDLCQGLPSYIISSI